MSITHALIWKHTRESANIHASDLNNKTAGALKNPYTNTHDPNAQQEMLADGWTVAAVLMHS